MVEMGDMAANRRGGMIMEAKLTLREAVQKIRRKVRKEELLRMKLSKKDQMSISSHLQMHITEGNGSRSDSDYSEEHSVRLG